MQALTVDGQKLGRGGDNRLQLVFKRPTILGLGLAQFINNHNFSFERVAPLTHQLFVAHQRHVYVKRTANSPKEGRPECILATARAPSVQDGVIDFAVRVLDLVRHDVEHMRTLGGVRQHALGVGEPGGHVAAAAHGGAGVAPAVAVHEPAAGNQNVLACGVGHADQRVRALFLAVLVIAHRRLDHAPRADGTALDMPVERIERAARDFATLKHVKVRVIILQIGKALEPFAFRQSAELTPADFLDHDLRRVGERLGRRDLGQRRLHGQRQQVIAQAVARLRAALVLDPAQEALAAPIAAVLVETIIGAVDGVIPALGVMVRVLGVVRAHDARPTLAVRRGEHQPALGEPGEHWVVAVILQRDMRMRRRVGRCGRDTELLAERLQQVNALGVKLGELRGEVLLAFFQINRAGNAEVTDSIDSPSVGVSGLGDRHDRGGKLALFGLVVIIEYVAPLEVAGAGFNLPRRLHGRRLRLGANVIEHHERHMLGVAGAR